VRSDPKEVIFELTIVGASARVCAVDVASGVEAVVIGPASAARSDLESLALRKLQRLLAEAPPPAPALRGGIVL
jgi:hypothetical protein